MKMFSLSVAGCLLMSSGLGCGDMDAASRESTVMAESQPLVSAREPARQGPLAFVTEKIGNPLWEPVDFHQVTVDMSPYAPTYFQPLLEQIMPAPNHVWNDALGIGPGAAHSSPYDHELEDGLARLGLRTGSLFSTAEATWPNAILSLWMVVPSASAPLGSSPDFDRGAVIPHTIVPINVNVDLYMGGAANPEFNFGFDVPALDTIDPPINVEGHSHFPIFTYVSWDQAEAGRHFLDTTITDNEGNGWKVKQTFVLQGTPAP
jgi:hypothetical protein